MAVQALTQSLSDQEDLRLETILGREVFLEKELHMGKWLTDF